MEEQSPREEHTLTRRTGQVKWFDRSKGYGFITDLDSKLDYFVHHSALKEQNTEEYAYLVAGEYIEFDLSNRETLVEDTAVSDSQGKKTTLTSNVTGIRGGPLMYKVIKSNRNTQLGYVGFTKTEGRNYRGNHGGNDQSTQHQPSFSSVRGGRHSHRGRGGGDRTRF